MIAEELEDMRDRIVVLERADSYHQRSAEESSAQIYELFRRLDRLEKTVGKMTEKLKELAEDKEPSLPVHERPPHY